MRVSPGFPPHPDPLPQRVDGKSFTSSCNLFIFQPEPKNWPRKDGYVPGLLSPLWGERIKVRGVTMTLSLHRQNQASALVILREPQATEDSRKTGYHTASSYKLTIRGGRSPKFWGQKSPVYIPIHYNNKQHCVYWARPTIIFENTWLDVNKLSPRDKFWWHRFLTCAGASLASRLHFFSE